MDMLELIGSLGPAKWLALLMPCLVLFAFIYWQAKRKVDQGTDSKRWSQLRGWPARLKYLLNLLAFAVVSFLALGLSMLTYQNIVMAGAYLAPAPSEVVLPVDFPHELQPVQFKSDGALRLHGWLIEPDLPAIVILLHGYDANRTAMLWHADQLARAGFGILLYDERASGMSGGEQRSYGWQDPTDVSAALDWLQANPSTSGSAIGIGGCSIGAQIALQAAASDSRLKAVWADGPSIVRPHDLPPPHNWASAISVISSRVTDWTFAAILGRIPPPPLLEQLPTIEKTPVMLVGGAQASISSDPNRD
ncbi:MAG: alpha/beta hydrolase [Anaerolineales bacterium]